MFAHPAHRSVVTGAPPPIITDGLYHRWTCDDGVGSQLAPWMGAFALDAEQDLTWVSGLTPAYSSAPEFTTFGARTAAGFDSGIGTGDFSICLFMNLRSVPPDQSTTQFIMVTAQRDNRPAIVPWQDGVTYPNVWGARHHTDAYDSSNILSVGTTYHICIVRRVGQLYLYQDGVLDPNNYANTRPFSEGPAYRYAIASDPRNVNERVCNMRANDLRVYTRGLSDSEVAQIAAGNG